MTGNFPGKLVLSLRQTDFQTLRAVKIGPLPCGGHASSATGGAVPARPLIRHGLWPCHLPPEGKAGISFFYLMSLPVSSWRKAVAVPSLFSGLYSMGTAAYRAAQVTRSFFQVISLGAWAWDSAPGPKPTQGMP